MLNNNLPYPKFLQNLPLELCIEIVNLSSKNDLKSLRLTCKDLNHLAVKYTPIFDRDILVYAIFFPSVQTLAPSSYYPKTFNLNVTKIWEYNIFFKKPLPQLDEKMASLVADNGRIINIIQDGLPITYMHDIKGSDNLNFFYTLLKKFNPDKTDNYPNLPFSKNPDLRTKTLHNIRAELYKTFQASPFKITNNKDIQQLHIDTIKRKLEEGEIWLNITELMNCQLLIPLGEENKAKQLEPIDALKQVLQQHINATTKSIYINAIYVKIFQKDVSIDNLLSSISQIIQQQKSPIKSLNIECNHRFDGYGNIISSQIKGEIILACGSTLEELSLSFSKEEQQSYIVKALDANNCSLLVYKKHDIEPWVTDRMGRILSPNENINNYLFHSLHHIKAFLKAYIELYATVYGFVGDINNKVIINEAFKHLDRRSPEELFLDRHVIGNHICFINVLGIKPTFDVEAYLLEQSNN